MADAKAAVADEAELEDGAEGAPEGKKRFALPLMKVVMIGGAVLGAVLLTGFLGGAISVQMRAGTTTFEQVFPVIFGILMWGGIYLRECGLRRVFPVKR